MVEYSLGEEINGFLSKGRLRFDSSYCTNKIKLVTIYIKIGEIVINSKL